MDESNKFEGAISWNALTIPIEFYFSVGSDGTIGLRAEVDPTQDVRTFISQVDQSQGPKVEQFRLHGTGRAGVELSTDHAYLDGFRHSPGKLTLPMSSLRLELTWPNAGRSSATVYEYLVQGLRAFRPPVAEGPAGIYKIGADSKPEDYSQISGAVHFSPHEPDIDAVTADGHMRRFLDVLSLAQGRFLRWTARRVFSGDEVLASLYLGRRSSTDPRYPVFSYVHLAPALQLAVQKCTPELCEATGLDVAIEWALMHSHYSELDFLASMTALEHLIARHSSGSSASRVRAALFKQKVRPVLADALDTIKDLEPQVAADLRQALGNLNRKSLRDNMMSMLREHRVPLVGIESEIQQLIGLRNDIVHRGQDAAGTRLDSANRVVRELLVRIFLTQLGYEGQYQSYLNGPEWADFPPRLASA